MGRPVTSALSIPEVLCSDGVKRTFRFYSAISSKGVVRVSNVPVAGDIRPSKHGGYYFYADPLSQNYNLLPNDITVESLYAELRAWLDKVKAYGVGDPDPIMLMRFCGFEVNEEEGWIDAPEPVAYNELDLGSAPPD